MADPARVYPVTLDPSSYTPTQDCDLDAATPTTSLCSHTDLDLGYDGSHADRTLLQFAFAGSILNHATVTNAKLGLDLTAESTTTPTPIDLHALTRAWTNSATWDTYNGTNAWTTAGGDYSSTVAASNSSVGGSTGWYAWYPTQLVQNWVDGTTANDGLLLKEPSETVQNVLSFPSTESATSADWPFLQVSWQPALGNPGYWPLVRQTLGDGSILSVNPANGNLELAASDLAMPGIGLPLSDVRYYNSQQQYHLELGPGWHLSLSRYQGIYVFDDGSLYYNAPSGTAEVFNRNADGSYTAPPGLDATMVKNGDGSYTLTDHASQVKRTFDVHWHLVSITDRSGNTLSLHYDPTSSNLTSVTDTQGRTTAYSDDANGYIAAVTDPAGLTYQYSHGSNGQLTSATDPAGNVTQYAYGVYDNATGLNLLTQITDPDGNITTIGYTSSGDPKVSSITRVTTPSTGAGATTSFTYNTGTTVITDPKGHATTDTLDALGRATAITDALSQTAHLTWTADDQIASVQTPSGTTTTYSYDSLNRLTQITPPAGNSVKAAYGDSSFPYQPSATTDAQGNTTTYGYNTQGLLTSVTDPSGHSSSATYNSNGNMASATDQNGHTTSYTSTSSGMPSTDTPPSPLGTTSYAFTTANQESSVTDGNGKVTTFTYDADGRVTAVGYADNTSIIYTYGGDGNVTPMVDSSGTTSYTYNALNQLTKETLPSGQSISYTYDAAGNLTGKTDSGGTVGYGYNQLDEGHECDRPAEPRLQHRLRPERGPNQHRLPQRGDRAEHLQQRWTVDGHYRQHQYRHPHLLHLQLHQSDDEPANQPSLQRQRCRREDDELQLRQRQPANSGHPEEQCRQSAGELRLRV